MSAILVFLCGPIYRMMSVPEEIFDEAVLYIRIMAPVWCCRRYT